MLRASTKTCGGADKLTRGLCLLGWFGPANLGRLEELSQRGVVGFKAFMANSGIEDFPHIDASTLRAGMKRAAELGRIVAVHAESQAITSELTRRSIRHGKLSVRDYLHSRPIPAELEAIRGALELAGETGCALHIVHVSCGAGLELILSAQKLGVDVTCETCPHYLALTEDDMLELGAVAKCAPPLRAKSDQDALWQYLKSGQVDTVGSDHSPCQPALKKGTNFFKVWGGISGIQHTLPILLTEGHFNRAIALPLLVRWTSHNVARRFDLPPAKGEITLGADADLALLL